MSEVVYKYLVLVQDQQSVWLPEGAKILKFGMQDGSLYLWAQVSIYAMPTPRKIKIFGTGHEIRDPENLKHLETVFNGEHVLLHIYEDLT